MRLLFWVLVFLGFHYLVLGSLYTPDVDKEDDDDDDDDDDEDDEKKIEEAFNIEIGSRLNSRKNQTKWVLFLLKKMLAVTSVRFDRL